MRLLFAFLWRRLRFVSYFLETHLICIFNFSFYSTKMAASIRQNLSFFIFKHASNKNARFCKSPVSLSILVHFFSTQTPTPNPLDINPTVYDILVHKHDFPCDFASRVSSKLSHIKNPERVDSMLTFLKCSGFSNAQLQKILKHRPRYLCLSVEDNIKPKLKGFQDEGFSSGDISKIITNSPRILALSLNNNIVPSLSVLKGLLRSNSALLTVVRKYPNILISNTEGTVVANVEFLKSIGISMDRIRSLLNGNPATFISNPQVTRAAVDKAKEMGLTASSRPFMYAVQTIASMTNKSFELKLQAFRDMGFSESNISSMFRKEPRAFGVATEKMKKITKLLVATGKFDISSIAQHPKSFTYSFENRYEPRIGILRILESRKLIENWPTLRLLCRLKNAEFYKRFVSPYSDHLSDVCIPNLR